MEPSLLGRNFDDLFLIADMAVPDVSEFRFSCGVVKNLATFISLARGVILQHSELECRNFFFV